MVQDIHNVAIMGAGSVGAFYGAKIQASGIPVQYFSPSAKTKVKNLKIKSIWGDFSIHAPFFNDPSQMSPADLAVVSVKALEGIDYKNMLSPVLRKNSIILLLQNGINGEEIIRKIFRNNPVIGGLAFTCINRLPGDVIFHQDYGAIKMGALESRHNILAQSLVDLFNRAGIKTFYGESLRKLRWQKLLWNIPYNSLSVAAGMVTTDVILGNPKLHGLSVAMMEETARIAASEGITISAKDIKQNVENTRKMEPYKTSMMIDYQNKRPMEVEAILGEPLKIARKNRVETPHISTVYSLLHYWNQSNVYHGDSHPQRHP